MVGMKSDTLAPYSAEFVECGSGGPAAMAAGKIAAEHEYFIRLERSDVFRIVFHCYDSFESSSAVDKIRFFS